MGNREQHRGLESSWCTSSAVEQQDTHRKDKVEQLIEKFENYLNKESFLQDCKQTKEIDEFSKESKHLIADMNKALSIVLAEDA